MSSNLSPEQEVILLASAIEAWIEQSEADLAYLYTRKCVGVIKGMRPWLCSDLEYQLPAEGIERWARQLEQDHARRFGPPEPGTSGMDWRLNASIKRVADQIEWLVTHGQRKTAALLVRCVMNHTIIETVMTMRDQIALHLQGHGRAEREAAVDEMLQDPIKDDEWAN